MSYRVTGAHTLGFSTLRDHYKVGALIIMTHSVEGNTVHFVATQVNFLTSKYHIYLLKNGRINVCGVNSGNVEYVANAIKDAVVSHPEN